jgi:hypothetical protein
MTTPAKIRQLDATILKCALQEKQGAIFQMELIASDLEEFS